MIVSGTWRLPALNDLGEQFRCHDSGAERDGENSANKGRFLLGLAERNLERRRQDGQRQRVGREMIDDVEVIVEGSSDAERRSQQASDRQKHGQET